MIRRAMLLRSWSSPPGRRGAVRAPGDDDRPAALRRRRRLVRQPLEPAQPADRHPDPHRAPRGRRGEGRHAGRGRALERALHLHDGARQRPLERSRSRHAAPLPPAGRLPPRRRQLRHGRVHPARAGPALPGSPAGRGPARPSDLPSGLRLPQGHSQDPPARRQARAGVRHLSRRPARGLLLLPERPGRRVGGLRGASRSARRSTRPRCAWG